MYLFNYCIILISLNRTVCYDNVTNIYFTDTICNLIITQSTYISQSIHYYVYFYTYICLPTMSSIT